MDTCNGAHDACDTGTVGGLSLVFDTKKKAKNGLVAPRKDPSNNNKQQLTHNAPVAKTQDTPIFFRSGSFREEIQKRGINNMTRSEMRLMIAPTTIKAAMSTQEPPGVKTSQALLLGVHSKMMANMPAR